ncbi:hypothetical protein DdX_05755 [Ditylenchus destructor]|uniref:Uncharacterized protein n=1 Tax=Ditylenchus destructor TaxID=166010 RepID=A0AAD4NA92_9BILA|nr:hypothetical protein DdX_05755 [Ditylenchus destructor]
MGETMNRLSKMDVGDGPHSDPCLEGKQPSHIHNNDDYIAAGNKGYYCPPKLSVSNPIPGPFHPAKHAFACVETGVGLLQGKYGRGRTYTENNVAVFIGQPIGSAFAFLAQQPF